MLALLRMSGERAVCNSMAVCSSRARLPVVRVHQAEACAQLATCGGPTVVVTCQPCR